MLAKLLVLEAFILGLSLLSPNDSGKQFPTPQSSKIPESVNMDAKTVKVVEQAFREALEEELAGLETEEAKDIDGAEQQGKHAKQKTAHRHSEDADLTGGVKYVPADDIITEFEKDVSELILGLSNNGIGATPMGSSVMKIKRLIEKDMMPKVLAAHSANQDQLDRLAKAAKECSTSKNTAQTKAVRSKNVYEQTSPLHQACRVTEASLYTETMSAWTDMKAKKNIRANVCRAYSDTSKRVGEQTTNKGIVSKGPSESVESYLTRISSTICGKPGGKGNSGHGQGGFLDEYLDAKLKCQKATKDYNTAHDNFKDLDRRWHNQKEKCNNIQDTMDNSACKHAVEVKDACEAYTECYTDSLADYNLAEKTVREEETNRKAEWRGLKRIQCLIGAFSDGKVTDLEVNACKDAKHDTAQLDITYPSIGDMDTCAVSSLYPHTPAYKLKEFTPLPALAKGRVDANECNGVREVSTTPAVGSPPTCKCSRVTLNGPYSGALVKCENCIDTRRSAEKNSCPAGTKLFAPESRTEWETFLKSAGPLRAPNWIIDVTRPQNGCGGCTGSFMNSKVALQSTWATSDGAPWWLRSKRYNEPNGDYQANCYLDLWHNPSNADSITFNDLNCNYHSKSYYCHTRKISLKPKPGSPSGCSCKKIEIATGTYSAGVLVKCSACLRVSRSRDKNSCPAGMKLFSPRTREDWKAFLSSATPLRDPHWIVDITRPQNGCGGCTRHQMNSRSPPQATWKTADGSPWWLRSTRYNEPNGDYTANCYLDLWHTPSNENGVTFNDWRCRYSSKSYYCQPVKGSVASGKVTTTPPPWRSVSVSTRPKSGSPSGCKCTQLKLVGTYSAGALLKCAGCLDVRRTTQKNSCPEGTKIFSPQSRDDWRTFFASEGKPLYAPNWIIDITRPRNGCGGCTGQAMNSGNSRQSTWKTSDGSPWWLRAGTYNEPNGDYTANCYLDLWRSPQNEDSITWNDGNCNYHSTSYYCQPNSY